MLPVDLETATVAELTRLLADQKITSVDLTQAYLDRIAALNSRGPALGAVRTLNPNALAEAEAADHRADGSLRGIPVLIKDNIDVEGLPTTAGSVALAHSYPAGDAALVANLRAAGAVILGKANLTEFANFLAEGMPGGYSSLGGQVRNPYDAARSPSGSSAGSAVAAAAGLAALTIGTETNGSILGPAVANSVVGLKPTVGLVSGAGVVPIATSQDTVGPITRTVADAAVLLTALTNHDLTVTLSKDGLRGTRIGVPQGQDGPLWTAALTALRDLGATLVPVTLDTDTGDSTVLHYEFKRDLNEHLASLPSGAPVRSLAEVLAYNEANAPRMLKYGQARALPAQAMDLSPDSADTARHRTDRAQDLAESRDRIDAVMSEHDVSALLFAGTGSAHLGALAGYPSITVPAGYDPANRRPFGISFLGQSWSEPTLLAYAYAYEQSTHLRRPPSEINPALFHHASP
jgi:amidase